MKKLISKLTMKKGRYLLTDIVNGKEVFEYTDYYGDKYMAQSKYGFRVLKSKGVRESRSEGI